MDCEIRVSAQGDFKQKVHIIDPHLTIEDLQAGLNSGRFATSIQEGGVIEEVGTGRIVGSVVSVDNRLEYSDFEVEKV